MDDEKLEQMSLDELMYEYALKTKTPLTTVMLNTMESRWYGVCDEKIMEAYRILIRREYDADKKV